MGYSPCGHKESDMTDLLSMHTMTQCFSSFFFYIADAKCLPSLIKIIVK